jgi:serine/threonine-protein kinase
MDVRKYRRLNDYLITKTLGSGAYGTVYEAINLEGRKIALKVINIPSDNPSFIKHTEQELKNLQKLSVPFCNPHVICYYGGYVDDNKFLIEMELIQGIELDKFVNRLKKTKSPQMVYYYLLLIAKDIADGLKFSHEKGIIHNDIKPSNIMVDKNNVLKIIDYGMSCYSPSVRNKECVRSGGTPYYMAPEYIAKNMISYPVSDMWSLGITLYYLATNTYPFQYTGNESNFEIFYITEDRVPAELNTSNPQLNNLVNGLLVKDPAKRLTASAVIKMLNVIPRPMDIDINENNNKNRSNVMDISAEDLKKINNKNRSNMMDLSRSLLFML